MGKKPFISIVNQYFNRFPFRKINIALKPSNDLKIIVVIPSYNEKNIQPTIDSLFLKQDDFSFNVEVIVLINNSESEIEEIKEQNLLTLKTLQNLSETYSKSNMHLIPVLIGDLDAKHAGVGWARKLGMDIATQRFRTINFNGTIVGLDADTVVESNYLNSIYSFFSNNNFNAASIYFEHPITGDSFSDVHLEQIKYYELHLRYYKNSLKYSKLPYSFHTIGSAFALTASAYARQGGMNRRKAGEDFYFINKLIKGEIFGEINDTKVMPSPRVSNRVPFGTGRAILEGLNTKKDLSLTYDFQSFEVIHSWINRIETKDFKYENFPEILKAYLGEEIWIKHHTMMLNNTNSHKSYLKLFYNIFDAFWMLKFIHYLRDNYYPNTRLLDNTNALLIKMNYPIISSITSQLEFLRKLDKKKGQKPL
ncbi:MAG: glycosyltransferase [Parvicellaceae bacterium]